MDQSKRRKNTSRSAAGQRLYYSSNSWFVPNICIYLHNSCRIRSTKVRTKTPSLCMQYSLLSQESPPSIKTLRLEIGLCHEKNGAPRFCLTYLEDWQRILAGQQKMPDRSSSCGFKGKECTSFSICKTTFLLDS